MHVPARRADALARQVAAGKAQIFIVFLALTVLFQVVEYIHHGAGTPRVDINRDCKLREGWQTTAFHFGKFENMDLYFHT